MTKQELKKEIYRLTDSFLTEAKDQNGRERSLERLNQDRHLFVEDMFKLVDRYYEDIVKIDPQDMKSLLNFLEGNTERKKIVNFIRMYIYNP